MMPHAARRRDELLQWVAMLDRQIAELDVLIEEENLGSSCRIDGWWNPVPPHDSKRRALECFAETNTLGKKKKRRKGVQLEVSLATPTSL
jgi:hypothetical protein